MDPPATALRLKPIHIRGFPPLLEIPEEGLTIGRADENQVVLPGDAFPHVSALHARIEMRDGELMIEDLDSKNGTLVNGKPVEQRPLSKGDVVQLGSLGPRFLVVTAGDIDATVSIAPGAVPGALGTVEADQRSPGATTILRLKSALGIPAGEGGVRRLVERRSRRLMLIGAFLLIAFVTTWVGLYLRQERRRAGEVAGLLERLDEANDRVAAQGRALEVQRRALEGERDRLRERIRTLEEEKRVSVDEVDLLRRELTATEEKLELYSPIRLEKEAQERMAQVMGVRSAVVLIETRVRYRERGGPRQLHAQIDPLTDHVDLNLEGRGEAFEHEGSGSGFCVSVDGWILTNAHVASPVDMLESVEIGGVVLEPELKVDVVFTDSSTRRRAEVVRVEESEEDDLALIKIEPFEGMAHVASFDPSAAPPATGSEIYLFGFPLGKHAVQEGDIVKASTFRGILSRQVASLLQVDAAVYPGNSGGPLVDRAGHVIGIATAVQTIPKGGGLADAMGYVIPIASAGKVWPPPQE